MAPPSTVAGKTKTPILFPSTLLNPNPGPKFLKYQQKYPKIQEIFRFPATYPRRWLPQPSTVLKTRTPVSDACCRGGLRGGPADVRRAWEERRQPHLGFFVFCLGVVG
ncbi:uncharacterized protein LOC128035948 [Gossypium raimondii]|uniref:uncharacterized protein LOC128035948 n=1 Tax=Gossypium raimondii TaxID=29730 RepID=UPI00227CE064|nr:uncharacterized protein LOC128035948 [Gossypium raimondii]